MVLEGDGPLARNADEAVGVRILAGKGAQKRALAGAAGAEQGRQLALVKFEVDPRRAPCDRGSVRP